MGRAYIGIEIGGTKLQLGLGFDDESIAALWRGAVEPSRGAPGILAQIADAYPRLLAQAKVSAAEVAAVGVGFGGPVDSARGVVHHSFQVQGWDQFPLADWIRTTLGLSHVAVANDADSAGLAEAIRGAGKGCSPLLYSNVGSGIGGALIIAGAIYDGSGAGALEIGHLLVPDPLDPSAPVRELEHIASGWAIAQRGRETARQLRSHASQPNALIDHASGDPEAISAVTVFQAAQNGDPIATAIVARARAAFAFALAQAVTLLAPKRIVIGGGVSLADPNLWLLPLRGEVAERTFPPFRDTFDIVTAALGEEVVVHGALELARSRTFPR